MNQILKVVFLIYFITHIPITFSLDLQVIFGAYYPPSLVSLAEWYVATYQDQLIRDKPLWLRSFIWAEFLFQTPFFFLATYGLLYEKNWIRIPSIMYGTHVATTVWPIIAEILWAPGNTDNERLTLLSFYLPYFVIPLTLATYMAIYNEPFPKKLKPKRS